MQTSTRVLIVGVGSIGERHWRCFHQTGEAIVSLAEVNPRLRGEVAGRYPVDGVYESVAAALAQPHDAAVICTPAHTHIDLAIQCVEAGLHVLIEKPLSVRRDRIAELAQRAAERQRVVAVAYVLRAHPALAAMRDDVVRRRFGRPLQIVGVAGQHFPTYRPAYREIYYARRESGGGAIQDALTHVLNAGEWLVGPMERVTADAAHLRLPGVTVEDTVHVLARHGDVLGCYSLNQHQAPFELSLTVVCEEGTMRFDGFRNRYLWMTTPGGEWQVEREETLERDQLFTAQARHFLAALRGAPPACTLAEGEQTLRAALAILSSTESGKWQPVSIPLQDSALPSE